MKMSPALQMASAVAGAALTAYLAELAIREREHEAYAEGLLAGQTAAGPRLVHEDHPSQYDAPDVP